MNKARHAIQRRGAHRGVVCRFALPGIALVVLSGCAMLHHDSGPVAQLDAEQAQLAPTVAVMAGDWPSKDWWQSLQDPQLTAFVERALTASPTMQQARQRVSEAHARAELAVAVSGLQLSAVGTIDRERVSSHGFLSAYSVSQPAIGASGPWYTTGLLGFNGSWDIDIWGLHRAQIDAAIGVENARKTEVAEVALELSADVASVYYSAQTALSTVALLTEEKDAIDTEVDAHRWRFSRGLEPKTLLEQAQSRLATVEQQIEQTSETARDDEETLRALIGAGPGEPMTIEARPLPAYAAGVPANLGFQLLARRPDLQALHWYVDASLKSVNAAKAAFYPNFDIKAFFGFDALDLSQLFLHASQQINIAPGLYLPIFDGGRLNANLHEVRASSNALILQYNQAVLNAVRDVAQIGSTLKSLDARTVLQRQKLDAAGYTLASAAAQYDRGLADKLQVAQARESAIDTRVAMLSLSGNSLQEAIAMTKALGGGYDEAAPSR